ncbi:MAG TPA: hypothetical protein VGS41_13190 [Chthonomonadales bacterium]|nr:hypothetical protein [Chthonomonadales bacterium]
MIDYVPFQADLIPEAAKLPANRHCQDRLRRPELSPRFEVSEVTQQALTLAYQRPHTQGVAALQGGKLLGYLFGTLTINALWGRTGWVRPVGCSLDQGSPLDLLAELYARLGQQWIDYGCFAHYVITSILDSALVDNWFSLGFAIEQVRGLYSMKPPSPATKTRRMESRSALPPCKTRRRSARFPM